MTAPLDQIWVVLSATPRFGLTLTRLAHQAADCLDPRIGMNPPANPVAMAIAIPVLVLKLAIGGTLLAVLETLSAKMRIFRVPEFLATAFLLAVIGMLVHILVRA